MALDEERFTHLRLYQTIFPAVVFLRSIDALAWLDRRAGGLLGRLVRWSEKLFFRGWQDIHPMSFNRPEEDEAFFVYTLVADSIFLLFPYPRELWGAAFADDLPPKTRRRLMRFYVSCLRRHLHATGPGKTLLVKNTPLCGRLTSLLEAIPDARVISIIRHPDASVPSHVSPFWRTWSVHSPEIAKDSEESRVYAEVAVEWFRRIFGNRERFDRRRHLLLRYDELIADPVRTVEAIYRHFDLPLGDGFRKRLAVAAEKARRYRSNHAYSLEEFGLSPAWIRERLGGLIDSYALESEPAALAPPHGRPAVAAAAGKQSTAVGGLT
jgi:hypothetical protein